MEDLSIKISSYVLTALVLFPMALLIFMAGPRGLYSAFSSISFRTSLELTLFASAAAVAIDFALGTPVAYGLARGIIKGGGAVYDVLLAPVSIPHTVVGIMLLLAFSPPSPIYGVAPWLSPIGTLWGLILALSYVSMPIYIMSLREHFEMIDRESEMYILSMGVPHSVVLRSVVLRGSFGPILRVSLLSMGRAISEFGSVVILTYSVLAAPLFYYTMPSTVFIWYNYEVSGLYAAVSYAAALLLVTLLLSVSAYAISRIEH